jgi:hypothetical protein
MIANNPPTVLVRYVETNYGGAVGLQSMGQICFNDLPGSSLVPVPFYMRSKPIVENIGEAFEEDRWRMKALNFSTSVEPRMAQAASQSQVSRFEMYRCSSGEARVL